MHWSTIYWIPTQKDYRIPANEVIVIARQGKTKLLRVWKFR